MDIRNAEGTPRPANEVAGAEETTAGAKGRRQPPILRGVDNGFFGKQHSEETKSIIRKKATGRKRSAESKQHQSETAGKKYATQLENGNFLCARCGKEKPPIEFSAQKRRDKWPKYSYCRQCHADYEYERKLKRFFHLTLAEDHQILEFQNNVCAICHRPAGKFRLSTEHRHSDGLIRGKVCWFCNSILAASRGDPERLSSAAEFLRNPPAVQALGREVYGLPGRTNTKKQRKLARKLEKITLTIA
jgi:Recombination endonuclease VII/NUMOD3 motif